MLAKSHAEILQRTSSPGSQYKGQRLDDKYLWQSIREDNELSFSILYKKYTKLLYNYGMNSCRDHSLVMDCLQELFTSLWGNRRNLTDVYAVNAYLFKSFRRMLIKKLTWRKRFSLSLDSCDDRYFEIVFPIEDKLEQTESEAERLHQLKSCMAGLTRRQREALFLKFYNNLDYNSIASVMDLQVDSVYNIVSKALDCLRNRMSSSAWLLLATLFSI